MYVCNTKEPVGQKEMKKYSSEGKGVLGSLLLQSKHILKDVTLIVKKIIINKSAAQIGRASCRERVYVLV